MALPRKLKYLNLFNDGNNYQGIVEELTLPKLSRKLEAYRGAGMNGSAMVDLGLDEGALDAEFTLGGVEAQLYKQWGIAKADGVMLRFAGSFESEDNGEVVAVEVVMRGRFQEFDHGTYKQGDNTQTKITAKNTYFKLTWNGEELIEIDTINMVEKVGGEDRLEQHRRAIGLF
ncbi:MULTISPECIES: phage major tail tube protein [Xenorhabdus]|uniref:Major tail tube protein n=5 Tax=Xenorhabdus TaxID=626 RepID=A0A2D0IL29_9GAMM|nr:MULTISPECIES: phage major tail tube protein [Xenorhabdus]BET97501.1 phage major tail tube protein [Xenorhabdus sp. TCT-1]MBC8949612.1 major tail tube protein [Xenorhabdus sp. TS4]MBC8954693.1 major tail tube protein [Xenorhabdus sp. PB62.4]MBD1229444.1 phage major tail tube protein [Xenorhabdus griffiniae]MBE8587988.1 phage major tail tube protein [Xenorhabdus griffiniae]